MMKSILRFVLMSVPFVLGAQTPIVAKNTATEPTPTIILSSSTFLDISVTATQAKVDTSELNQVLEPENKPWNLKQCIDYALEHNIQVQQAILKTNSSKLQVQQAKNNRLPGLNAGISDGYSFGRSQSRAGVYEDQNSNSVNASLDADLPLFQGLYNYNNIESRKFDLLASIEDQAKIKNDIRLNIASMYLNVLIQKELLKVSTQHIKLTDSLVIQVEQRVENGRDPISKLYEIKAKQASEFYKLTDCAKNVSLAILDLAQLLDVHDLASFDIEEPVFEQGVEAIIIPNVLFENALVRLPDVKAEEFRLKSKEKEMEMTKASYFPSLALSASTSTGAYYLADNAIPDDLFGAQLSNNWRSYVGVSMSIPIFNKMNVKNSVSQNKIQMRQQELQIENTKKTIYKDIQKAMLNAQVAKERYAAAEKSVRANFESYQFVEQSFSAGKANTFDLQQSRLNLEQSLSDQIQSKYEFIFNIKVLDFYNGKEIAL